MEGLLIGTLIVRRKRRRCFIVGPPTKLGARRYPSALLEQLADGGVLIIPVGETKQTLTVVRRFGDEFEQQRIGDVRFVPLVKGATQ